MTCVVTTGALAIADSLGAAIRGAVTISDSAFSANTASQNGGMIQ